jgi:hypothetical protein
MIKKVEKEEAIEVVPTPIKLVSVDYGREDINDLAKTVNEIIIKLNG